MLMKKILLSAVFLVAMVVNATAGDIKFHTGTKDNVPGDVSRFLNMPVGKGYAVGTMEQAPPRKVEIGPNVQVNLLLNEDFSLFTAGSEEAPDPVDVMLLPNSDDFFLTPGWSGIEVHQAGGKAFFEMGVDDKGEDNPGYLMTPDIDLSQGQGIYRATFRVKNANPNSTDAPLQYFVLNNDPNNRGIIKAEGQPMSNEQYTDVVIIGANGVKYTSLMFLSWRGKIFVENFKLEELIFPLAIPQNIKMELTSANTIKASWDAVEGATSYTVALLQDGNEIVTVEVPASAGNSVELTGDFTPGQQVGISVIARNGDDHSYPGYVYGTPMPEEIGTPVALEATNVTENGFTANWEETPFAANYQIHIDRTHEVTEEGEEIVYLYEDFQEVPFESSDDQRSTIVTTDGMPVYLDDYINYPGWSTFLCSIFKGVLAITNMYEAYGIPGVLMGPQTDYSLGGGKVKVSGMCLSFFDDAVLKVGFGTLGFGATGYTINFEEGAKDVDVSTAGTFFNVELEGGGADKQICFQMTDGAQSGDMVAFLGLNISSDLLVGDKYTAMYKNSIVPGGTTSFDVEAPLVGNDEYSYYVVGTYGDMKSKPSNVITVSIPNAIKQVAGITASAIHIEDGCIVVDNPTGAEVTVFSTNGIQVSRVSHNNSVRVPVTCGTYIVKVGDSVFKVLR